MIFVVLVWGLNFPILKAALSSMPLHVLNAFRFVVSAVVLGGLYYARQRRTTTSFFEPLRLYGRQIAALGLLGFVLYQLFFIIGIDHTKAGNAALIMASAPLWTAVTGKFFRLEILKGGSWAGLVTTLTGTVVIVVGGASALDFSSSTFVGNVIMLGAAMCWGVYTAFSRPVLQHVSATGLSFLSLLFALPFLFGIAGFYLDEVIWERIDLWVWLAILFSGGLSTGLAVAIWNNAIHQTGASHTAAFGNLVPLTALLSSFLLLSEDITAAQVAGGALIIGGLVLMRQKRF